VKGFAFAQKKSSLKKVASMHLDIFMGCWLLQTSRKYQVVAAPSLKSLCDEY
jgi:hypothetical protein